MADSVDESISALEEELDGASRTLSVLGALNARQAERVAERMDRLASQLLEVSPPLLIDEVHARLGTTPASNEDFASLLDEMGPPDGEG
jgi:hypothetical protein